MGFLTVWLKSEDNEESIENYQSSITNEVDSFCQIQNLKFKVSPSKHRITVNLLCGGNNEICRKNSGSFGQLISNIEREIHRCVRGIALCKG